jgi:hypothetical protein
MRKLVLVSMFTASAMLLGASLMSFPWGDRAFAQLPEPLGSTVDQVVDTLDPDPAPPAADTPDQVRAKFFQGTACPGNDATDKMVKVGPLCVDVYEASVWSAITGGTEFGASNGNYPCTADGQNCTNVFARSVAGVTPSSFITWFQAQQACANAGKRLLTNAEWQMAAAGTPDGSTTSCNTNSGAVAPTGSFAGCVSNYGVQDMVGNLFEWVADWVPRSTACPGWGSFSANAMCLAGASTADSPGALIRGGSFGNGAGAGVFAVGGLPPSGAFNGMGFRCAR